MSRMKDLITDVSFALIGTHNRELTVGRGKKKLETVYTYKCEENGAVVQFHAHPTRAWNWVVCEGTNQIGTIVVGEVIEKFCEVLSKGGDIQVLKF